MLLSCASHRNVIFGGNSWFWRNIFSYCNLGSAKDLRTAPGLDRQVLRAGMSK